uniref:NADH-ubiquinone oxidoreductase chain 6 n=1 Tax=Pherbellia dubia TaxID=2719086 RepID=A0A7D6W520_9MUSC|nr:NADH dehydrogenase subunit 6 [Pherbellia dubia]
MMQLILTSMLLTFSLIFMLVNHPLAMGLMLLIQTMLISLFSGLMAKSFWFSYMLFLIFLGGMLVLFIYVVSLASNEMFSLSMKMVLMALMILMSSLILFFMIDKTSMNFISINNEMNELTDMISYKMENSIYLNKLYNFPTNMITIMLMNYLLITLIAIVKITNMFYGPLRKMN